MNSPPLFPSLFYTPKPLASFLRLMIPVRVLSHERITDSFNSRARRRETDLDGQLGGLVLEGRALPLHHDTK